MIFPKFARSKKILGLPNVPSGYKRIRKPKSRGLDTVKDNKGMTLYYRNGYLVHVDNPKGRLTSVSIVQSARPGFTVRNTKSPYAILGWGYMKAEKLAVRLALKGHRSVYILD